jgi:hypothetical protein
MDSKAKPACIAQIYEEKTGGGQKKPSPCLIF